MVWQAGTITGTVTASGNPVPYATITFSRLGYTLTTTANANGQYEVVAGAGTWTMTATAYGYQTATVNNVVVTQSNPTTQNFALTGLMSHTLSGFVTDGLTGMGVVALLTVVDEDLVAPVLANSDGSYLLNLPMGPHTIRIEHPGFATSTQDVTIAGNQTLNIPLVPHINYFVMDNQGGYPLYNWIDATSGTAYNLDDDASSTSIALPQPFTYFGTEYTSLKINSNGFVYFGTATYTTAHMVLPFEGRPNTDIMAFGEDLNPALGTQGTIYTLATGDLFVIEWHEVEHWASGFPETFEIVLNLATDEITFQYHTISWPDFTTAGIENGTGSVGQMYSYANSANLQAGRAVRFTPGAANAVNRESTSQITELSLAVTDITDPAYVGEPLTYTLTITNEGPISTGGVTLATQVPSGTSYNAAAASQGSCQQNNGYVVCNIGTLTNGATATVTLVVTANQAGTVNQTAGVYAAAGDPNIANNTATSSIQVVTNSTTTPIYLPFLLKP